MSISEAQSAPRYRRAGHRADVPDWLEAGATPRTLPATSRFPALRSSWDAARSSLAVVRQVGVDAFRQFKFAAILVAVSSSLGVAAKTAAIATLYQYAKAVVHAKPFVVAGFELTSENGLSFAACVTAFLMLSLAGAVLPYLSAWKSCRVARQYHGFCTSRFLSRLSGSGIKQKEMLLNDSVAMHVALVDARYCGLACREILSCILPLITLAVALGALFAINVGLTLFVLGAVLVYLGPSYWFGRNVARQSLKVAELSRAANAEGGAAIRRLSNSRAPAPHESAWLDQLFYRGKLRDYHDAVYGRLLVGDQGNLLNDVFSIFCTLAILLSFGLGSSNPQQDWTVFVAYLIALRYAIGNLRRLTANGMRFGRYFTQVRRYFDLVSGLTPPPEVPAAPPLQALEIEAFDVLADGEQRVVARTGDILYYLSPSPVNRYTLSAILSALAGGDEDLAHRLDREAYFCGRQPGFLRGSVAFNLLGTVPAPDARREAHALLDELGMLAAQPAALHLDAELSHDAWDEWSEELKLVLNIVPGLMHRGRLFLIDVAAFSALSEESASRVVRLLSGRVLVLVNDRIALPPASLEYRAVIVADRTRVRAVGSIDWFRKQRDALHREFVAFPTPDRGHFAGADCDDDPHAEGLESELEL